MKNVLRLFCLTLIALTHDCVFGQIPPHPWSATIKVVSEDGSPITGADASFQYSVPATSASGGPTFGESKGLTDSNGVFTASHTDSSWDLGATAEKAGFYTTHIGYQFYYSDTRRNPNFTLMLKKVSHPIPLYAKWIMTEPRVFKKTGRPPIVFNKTIGYDLIAGDWVAPFGKGSNTNIIVEEEFNKKTISDYDFKLIISFPNTGDGIQEFTVPDMEKGSELGSPHKAPADGYQPELTRENFHHPGQPGQADYNPDRNYFFRVRTVLDSNGNVKSALYGKIYGDPVQMNFRYYLNPTPNDRNIEFDPKHNLLTGIESFEQVDAP